MHISVSSRQVGQVCIACAHQTLRRIGGAYRNGIAGSLPIVGALAAASGFNAVTIFALYISSTDVRSLYSRPELLWLTCPILIYWLGRMAVLAHRRMIDDDPILFALRDTNSLLAG